MRWFINRSKWSRGYVRIEEGVFENTIVLLRRQAATCPYHLGINPQASVIVRTLFRRGCDIFRQGSRPRLRLSMMPMGSLSSFTPVMQPDFPVLEREVTLSLHSRPCMDHLSKS
jgi:hypothetical protein